MLNNNSLMDEVIPLEFLLSQNYPNPFKEKTVIKYCVAYKTRVRITVYNSEGKEIEKLVDEEKQAGTYEVKFSASADRSGKSRYLSNGYYFYRMIAGDYSSENKWLCINNLLRSNTMKSFLQTLFFFFLVTQICFAQWVQLGLDDKSIKDIAARNSILFAITSDSGIVYRSTDNGINWLQIFNTSWSYDIAFNPTGIIYIANWADSLSDIQKSTDNGNTWEHLNIKEKLDSALVEWAWPSKIEISPMGFLFCGIIIPSDPPLGFLPYEITESNSALGSFSTFAVSTDNGLSWTLPGLSCAGRLFDFRGQDVITTGWGAGVTAVCTAGYLSSDNGLNWTQLADVPYRAQAVSLCLDGGIICGAPSSYNSGEGLFHSSDLGTTWTRISSVVPETGVSIESGGMLVGTDGLGIFLFSYGGDSLGSHNDGLTNLNVHALTIDNNNYVYTGTDNGVWRRPLSEIVTSVEEQQTSLPSSYNLCQNYPNPFNPSTKIKYSVPQSSQVQIKVFDVLGNEIETLVNEEKPAGTYEITWYAENLSSGIYFYQLKAGEYAAVKKMILMK